MNAAAKAASDVSVALSLSRSLSLWGRKAGRYPSLVSSTAWAHKSAMCAVLDVTLGTTRLGG